MHGIASFKRLEESKMRIELFNRKTLHEFYELKIIDSLHISWVYNTKCAELTSKENTLGPSCIERYFECSADLNKKNIKKHIVSMLEDSFIDHLNENVGVECLIRKEEVPIEIYERIKA
jgi:hypothetical protein